MPRLPLTVAIWTATTAAAVAVATVGVRAVTSEVTAPVLPAVANATSDELPSDDVPRPSPSETDRGRGTDEPGDDHRGRGRGRDDPTEVATRPTPTPSPTDQPTRTPIRDETRTARSIGGSAAFRFDGTRIEVLWSTPSTGFVVEIHRDAADDVDVRFVSRTHESRIKADNERGTLRIRVEERPED